jgi:hypothetical protein
LPADGQRPVRSTPPDLFFEPVRRARTGPSPESSLALTVVMGVLAGGLAARRLLAVGPAELDV